MGISDVYDMLLMCQMGYLICLPILCLNWDLMLPKGSLMPLMGIMPQMRIQRDLMLVMGILCF